MIEPDPQEIEPLCLMESPDDIYIPVLVVAQEVLTALDASLCGHNIYKMLETTEAMEKLKGARRKAGSGPLHVVADAITQSPSLRGSSHWWLLQKCTMTSWSS